MLAMLPWPAQTVSLLMNIAQDPRTLISMTICALEMKLTFKDVLQVHVRPLEMLELYVVMVSCCL